MKFKISVLIALLIALFFALCSWSREEAELPLYVQRRGVIVAPDGTEYRSLRNGSVFHLFEPVRVGWFGDALVSPYSGYCGAFASANDPDARYLEVRPANSEFFSYYVRADLPDPALSLADCAEFAISSSHFPDSARDMSWAPGAPFEPGDPQGETAYNTRILYLYARPEGETLYALRFMCMPRRLPDRTIRYSFEENGISYLLPEDLSFIGL